VGEGIHPMLKLTAEEVDLLRELAKGPRTISGPRSHAGLKRLFEAEYVTALEAMRGDPFSARSALARPFPSMRITDYRSKNSRG